MMRVYDLKAGHSRRVLAGNNPVTMVDPMGLNPAGTAAAIWDQLMKALVVSRAESLLVTGGEAVSAGSVLGPAAGAAIIGPPFMNAVLESGAPFASAHHDLKWALRRPDQVRASSYNAAKESEDDCPKTLYHYTSGKGYQGIASSGLMNASKGAKNARFGPGQYFTNISPEMIGASLTLNQVMRSLFGMPFGQQKRMTHFLELDVSGLSISNPRAGTYHHRTEQPLDVSTRIVRGGERP